MKEKPFKQVNVATSDWAIYNQMAILESMKRGKRVSIPALLKEAVENYYVVDNVDSKE